MNLIHFRGLNCYLNCIVNAATFLGVNYQTSLATLWSETDFTYDSIHNVYLTKRMVTNLEMLGVKLEVLNCTSEQETVESLSLFQIGEWIILGMDAFYIPWNQYYHTLHDHHYFLARKETADLLSCFDPTYNQKNMQIMTCDIHSYVFDILRIHKVIEKPFHIGIMEECEEIIADHPKTQKRLLTQIYERTDGKHRDEGLLLAKYIDAMINNRYLYRHYLEYMTCYPEKGQSFFDNDFFAQWTAVKNGLFKASLLQNNEECIHKVCTHFNHLMNTEIAIAKQIMCKME